MASGTAVTRRAELFAAGPLGQHSLESTGSHIQGFRRRAVHLGASAVTTDRHRDWVSIRVHPEAKGSCRRRIADNSGLMLDVAKVDSYNVATFDGIAVKVKERAGP